VAVEDQDDPVALASTLDRVVRLQTVKCSPRNTKRSEATNAMWENCPPLLLEEELRRARPGVVVGFGSDVQWAFRRLTGFQPSDGSPNLMVGSLTAAGRQIPLYGLAHPLRGGAWQAGQNELVALLGSFSHQ
jgi:uracil-DNA glycosylase